MQKPKTKNELIIDVDNPLDVHYWCVILKLNPKKLRMAVRKAGNNVADVKEYIRSIEKVKSSGKPVIMDQLPIASVNIYNQFAGQLYAAALTLTSSVRHADELFVQMFRQFHTIKPALYDSSMLCTTISKIIMKVTEEHQRRCGNSLLKKEFTSLSMLHDLLFENLFLNSTSSQHTLPPSVIHQKIYSNH